MIKTTRLCIMGLVIITIALVGCAMAASDTTADEHIILATGTGNVIEALIGMMSGASAGTISGIGANMPGVQY